MAARVGTRAALFLADRGRKAVWEEEERDREEVGERRFTAEAQRSRRDAEV
jgi:hypothetical protein